MAAGARTDPDSAAPPGTARRDFPRAQTPRRAVAAAGVFGLTGVAAGAFGAHALKARLAPEALVVFETAARYQLVHTLALLAAAGVARQWPGRAARASCLLFGGGIVLFSGSLYALSLTGVRALGAITPVGGLLFLLGWLAMTWAALRGEP
jgi:uncharacterized membrane protein YgdD (TMEM256/DUF423 family)